MSKGKRGSQSPEEASVQDVGAILDDLNAVRSHQSGESGTLVLAESSLAKNWLTPEEDRAWGDL